jgi:hypothetical protein
MHTTIPNPEHATFYEMEVFFKNLFTTIGLPLRTHSSTGTATDEFRVFTLFDQPVDQAAKNNPGYVISVVVWKKEGGDVNKYLEYTFIRNGQVLLRDHHAGTGHDRKIPSWSAGVISLLSLAGKTLRYISETSKNAAATAATLTALYEDPSFSSIPASK